VPQGIFQYRCIAVDMSVARAIPTQIPGLEPGNNITSVLLYIVPTGTTGNLSFGQAGDAIPVQNGLLVSTDICNPMNQGVFLQNAAQVGVTMYIFATMGGNAVAQQGAL
jgi:hypothetical protein